MECIVHVQKNVGGRLRKLKNQSKGVKLGDGKGLAGKGRLTTSKIDILHSAELLWLISARKSQ